MSINLFSPIRLGALELSNRVFMAPMTRCRAGEGNVPADLMAQYYRQRATAGLLITEATQVAPEGVGYPNTPGLHAPQQVEGWKKVTRAVHEQAGRIFAQLWHVGRVSHPLFQPGEKLPVSASAIAARGEIHTPQGPRPYPTPRALETEEIVDVIDQFRQAARNAKLAGFDGVELHGANGYLPDQFLRDGTNQRTDRYGGSIENRARFHLEVTQALIDVWGPGRVAVRLSPSGTFNDMSDSDPKGTFGYAVTALGKLPLAYLHIMEAMEGDIRHGGVGHEPILASYFRPMFKGNLVVNSAFTLEKGQTYLSEGWADAVAFGTAFLANPDLPRRFEVGAALNAPDPATFYGGGAKGYVDYPQLAS